MFFTSLTIGNLANQNVFLAVVNNLGVHSLNHTTQSQCVFAFFWLYMFLYAKDKIRHNLRVIFNYIIQSDLTMTHFIFSNWNCYYKILIDAHTIIKNNKDPTYASHSSPPSLRKASCKTIAQYHSQDTNTDRVNTEYFHHRKDPSFCFYSHTRLPPTPTSSYGKHFYNFVI